MTDPTQTQDQERGEDDPPMKVSSVLEAHRCTNCGAVCVSCMLTDETRLPKEPA